MPDTAPAPTDSLVQRARRLPKVLLHDHLDGGLRVHTLLDLARQRGIAVPADDADTLAAWFDARAHAGSLVEYLRGFALTVAAMASPQALERVAFEAAEDARQDGCVLAEFRIAPLLFEAHGVSGEAAVEALLAGLARSSLASGLIVCAMRHLDDAEIARSAALALRYRGRGVVAFDLAGPEAGYPATRHATLLAQLRDEGLPLTLHAGEADEALRVLEAARLGARRVGHGVRLADLIDQPGGQALIDELRASGVHLEVCPTSNVHTGAATSIATHPIRALWDAGVSLSFHTDNQLISCLNQSTEAVNLLQHAGFDWADLVRMGLLATEASFLPAAQRALARQALLDWAAAENLGVV
ncbi:adenosine deaminase family protein [Aquabacterium sp.]|uniref:adenosine deaminase family protein n=1 Tax=Aquabacterium sp. TaxID=1872578 RepID=UPI002B55C127|nr:adenosine deaminase family protein [Aquabacterium sp.]HSW09259.1 adenosine deaminase family protein [Aquabacterium sp.]